MKKSLIYIFPAIMCLVGTHADAVTGWGNNKSVANAWGTVARGYTMSEYKYADTDENLCIANADPDNGCTEEEANELYECGTSANGCKYNVKITYTDYQLKLATDTLFRQVLGTLEREAQANYNAKLTEEQNMCVAANSGGVMGRKDMTGTYRWVKLKKNKVPKSYATAGLTDKDIDKSNDLYGSFCAARVTLQSDDADIQEAIRSGSAWATTYFAVGDVFTCGSWIPQSELQDIAQTVANRQLKDKKRTDLTMSQKWWVAGATLLGGAAAGGAADLLQTKTGLGGLLGTSSDSTSKLTETERKKLMDNYTANLTVYNNDCDSKRSVTKNLGRASKGAEAGFSLYMFTSGGSSHTCGNLEDYLDSLQSRLNIKSDGSAKDPDNARRWVDVGAGVLGAAGTAWATIDTMKDSNQKEYDAEEKRIKDEFMANVGSHIFCFIGAEEAGTFGDVVEVGME